MKNSRRKLIDAAYFFVIFLNVITGNAFSASHPKDIIDGIAQTLPGGKIKDSYIGDGTMLVIHINDLHGNPSVQRNIAQIIQHIAQYCEQSTVFVEGYWGEYDTSAVKNHPASQGIKNAVIEYFMNNGFITGTEYYSFVNTPSYPLFGIEDKTIYDANTNAFSDVMANNTSVQNYLMRIDESMASLREQYFSPELQEFYNEYDLFFNKRAIDFEEFLEYIEPYLASNKVAYDSLANLKKFMVLVTMQKEFSPASFKKELPGFVVQLKNYNTPESKNMISTIMQYMAGKASEEKFLIGASDFFESNQLDLEQFPQITLRRSILKLARECDLTQLLQEFQAVSHDIIEILAVSPEEKTICHASDYRELLGRLVSLQITAYEIEQYYAYAHQFSIESYAQLFASLSGGLFPVPSADSIACVKRAEEFYAYSLQRNEILLSKTLEEANAQGITSCIQVTGGFHTESILEELKGQGVSYISIIPFTDYVDTGNHYTEVMSGYTSYLERALGMNNFQRAYLAPELRGVRLIVQALNRLEGVNVSEQFGRSVYNLMQTLSSLNFEIGGTILDLFKSSTPLSSKLIDDFLAGKITEKETDKVLEIVLASAPSPYFDGRYLRKLRDNEYLSISDEAITEFEGIITQLRKIDTANRKALVEAIQTEMAGLKTIEPNPVVRTYDSVSEVVNKLEGKSVVYISPEMKLIGGTRSWMAGGLGVLAGEYVEGLADMGVTTYGVTLYNTHSILQMLSPDNQQLISEVPIDYTKLPVYDTDIVVEQNAMGEPLRVRVWEVRAGEARIFALQDLTSDTTEMLYGGRKETKPLRERQNQLLGRAGIKAIEELYANGIIDHKPGIVHLNEANCYCALDEIEKKRLLPDEDALNLWQDVGRAFTTHTPVPAGLPMVYSDDYQTSNIVHLAWLTGMDPVTLMMFYVQYPGGKAWSDLDAGVRERLINHLDAYAQNNNSEDIDRFIAEFRDVIQSNNIVLSLTEGAAAQADGSTSVSLRHEQVTNEEIIRHSRNSPSRHGGENQATVGVTNGVIAHDWQPVEFQGVSPEKIPDQTILDVKRREKEELIDLANKRTGQNLSADHLTIAVMRRINTYKRTDLIVKEIDELAKELGDREINIIFSGMPHEQDKPALALFQNIQKAIQRNHPNIHIAFVNQYDISVAKHGVRGADIWLMQPVEKKEASSTSHQKALLAGTLVVSSYDGAMIENVVDFEVDRKNGNGAFITPIIFHRTVAKDAMNFIQSDTVTDNFHHAPRIWLQDEGEVRPVAVIDKGDHYVIIDAMEPDLSPQRLKQLRDSLPAYIQHSSLDFANLVKEDGTVDSDSFHTLMYDSLAPFSTGELHHLYDFNPTTWSGSLYHKLGSLARLYYDAQAGQPESRAQWVDMMRNSLRRVYEVDIHRMAAEYLRDIYSHILNSDRDMLQLYGDEKLLRIARKWRTDFDQAKDQEYDLALAGRLAWGYLGGDIGTSVLGLKTSAAALEGLHEAGTPLTVDADIHFGWVVVPEDFDIELYYGTDGKFTQRVPMELVKATDSIEKNFRFRAQVIPFQSGGLEFKVAIKPKNSRLINFIQFARDNRENNQLDAQLKSQISAVNEIVDQSLDEGYRKWSVARVAVNVIPPVVPIRISDGIDPRQRRVLELSL
ncbi:MAG: glycogen/starch/alpha-glucan phosphorylase [bacterium]|nr:glycogen/starch/alpha-glucan phosphorylase [bacterium]